MSKKQRANKRIKKDRPVLINYRPDSKTMYVIGMLQQLTKLTPTEIIDQSVMHFVGELQKAMKEREEANAKTDPTDDTASVPDVPKTDEDPIKGSGDTTVPAK